MTEIVYPNESVLVQERNLQGAIAALTAFGYSGLPITGVIPLEVAENISGMKTIMLHNRYFAVLDNEKIVEDFLNGAKITYEQLGEKFDGKVVSLLTRDLFEIIAENSSPMTQLNLKHVMGTKLDKRTQKYDNLLRERNYRDALGTAIKYNDVGVIQQILKVYSLEHEMDDEEIEIIHRMNNRMLQQTQNIHRSLPKHLNLTGHLDESELKKLYSELYGNLPHDEHDFIDQIAAIAVKTGSIELFQQLPTPINLMTLLKLAAFYNSPLLPTITEKFIEKFNSADLPFPIDFHSIVYIFAMRGRQYNLALQHLPHVKQSHVINQYIFEFGSVAFLKEAGKVRPDSFKSVNMGISILPYVVKNSDSGMMKHILDRLPRNAGGYAKVVFESFSYDYALKYEGTKKIDKLFEEFGFNPLSPLFFLEHQLRNGAKKELVRYLLEKIGWPDSTMVLTPSLDIDEFLNFSQRYEVLKLYLESDKITINKSIVNKSCMIGVNYVRICYLRTNILPDFRHVAQSGDVEVLDFFHSIDQNRYQISRDHLGGSMSGGRPATVEFFRKLLEYNDYDLSKHKEFVRFFAEHLNIKVIKFIHKHVHPIYYDDLRDGVETYQANIYEMYNNFLPQDVDSYFRKINRYNAIDKFGAAIQ
jgi:hypothetical protein